MLPTINSTLENSNQKGDTIYINKFASFGTNDIVVADVDWHTDYIIKRVVAAPGDRLRIVDQGAYFGVYVNDKLLYTRERKGVDTADIKTETIAYYAKYLDFINKPENSKYIYTINSKKYIVMPKGEYFLMGDNWGYTTDSMEHGPVKEHKIVGKVDAIMPQSHINFFTPTWFMLKLVLGN